MHDMARTAPRSFAGPIVLILIGLVFLLGNLGVLGWDKLITYFARLWPLLLIVWGLVKLAEYYSARNKGYAPRRIGAGGVFLVIVVVVLGLTASSLLKARAQMLERGFEPEPVATIFFGESHSFTDETTQEIGTAKSLRIRGAKADVTVRAWDEPRLKVVMRKSVRARTEDEARGIASKAQATVNVSGDNVEIGALPANVDGHPTRFGLELYLPRALAADLSLERGDVTIADRDAAVQVTTRGDVTVENVKGAVTLSVTDGDLRIANIKGDVTINGDVDDGSIDDVDGIVRIAGEVDGEITLARVTKGLSYRTQRDTIEVARIDGSMAVGVVRELHARGITGPLKVVAHSSKDVLVDDFSGDVNVETRNGEVHVSAAKAPMGNIRISTRNSDVTVAIPDRAAFAYSVRTRGGSIDSEIPELRINNDRDNESTAVGTVGNGTAKLEITNEHGDIVIRRNSVMPAVPVTPPAPPTAAPKVAPVPPAPQEQSATPNVT